MTFNALSYPFDYRGRIDRIAVFLNATDTDNEPSSLHARAGAAFLSEFPFHPNALRLEVAYASRALPEFESTLRSIIAIIRRLMDDAANGDTAAMIDFVRRYARPPGP